MGKNNGFLKEKEVINLINKKKIKDLNNNYKTKIINVFQGDINAQDVLICLISLEL